MIRRPPRSTLFPYTRSSDLVVRWTALVTASPLIAFSLAVGGTDVPVLACLCLGFALLWRRPRPVLAGLALGAAAAMKATARPRSEEHTSELQSQTNLVCRLL